jgi:hypothetical protein
LIDNAAVLSKTLIADQEAAFQKQRKQAVKAERLQHSQPSSCTADQSWTDAHFQPQPSLGEIRGGAAGGAAKVEPSRPTHLQSYPVVSGTNPTASINSYSADLAIVSPLKQAHSYQRIFPSMAMPTLDRFLAGIGNIVQQQNALELRNWLVIEPPYADAYMQIIAEIKQQYGQDRSQLEEKCKSSLAEAIKFPGERDWHNFPPFISAYLCFICDVNIDNLLETYDRLDALIMYVARAFTMQQKLTLIPVNALTHRKMRMLVYLFYPLLSSTSKFSLN